MANFPFFTNISPGNYGPTDTLTLMYHNNTELIVHADRLELVGDVREAALALVKTVLQDGSSATSWNDVLRAVHGLDGRYTLEYLRDDKPEFFDELKEQYEIICKMRAFI